MSNRTGPFRAASEKHSLSLIVTGLVLMALSPLPFLLNGIDPHRPVLIDLSNMRIVQQNSILEWIMKLSVTIIPALILILNSKYILHFRKTSFLAILFVSWSVISVSWSDVPSVSVRQIVNLLIPIQLGVLCAAMTERAFLSRVLVYVSASVALLSFAAILFLPAHGVHQFADASQNGHAGAWRGVFVHKNILGHMAACLMIAVLYTSREILRLRPKVLLAGGLSLLIIGSTSAGAYAISFVGAALTFVVLELKGIGRAVGLGVVATVALGSQLIGPLVLEILGRDPSLTGRTAIWSLAFQSIALKPFIGYGFGSSIYGGLTRELLIRFGIDHPHNGYLDVALGVGLIGLVAFLTWLAAAVVVGGSNSTTGSRPDRTAVAFLVMCGLSAVSEPSFRPTSPVGILALMTMTALVCRRSTHFGPKPATGTYPS